MRKTLKTRHRLQANNGSKQISFLAEPDYNPRWPNKNTLLAKALRLMLEGEEITSLNFQDKTSSQRLPAYIDKLSNEYGWPVRREDIAIRLKDKPKKRSFRKYYLDKDFIRVIKEISGGIYE